MEDNPDRTEMFQKELELVDDVLFAKDRPKTVNFPDIKPEETDLIPKFMRPPPPPKYKFEVDFEEQSSIIAFNDVDELKAKAKEVFKLDANKEIEVIIKAFIIKKF